MSRYAQSLTPQQRYWWRKKCQLLPLLIVSWIVVLITGSGAKHFGLAPLLISAAVLFATVAALVYADKRQHPEEY